MRVPTLYRPTSRSLNLLLDGVPKGKAATLWQFYVSHNLNTRNDEEIYPRNFTLRTESLKQTNANSGKVLGSTVPEKSRPRDFQRARMRSLRDTSILSYFTFLKSPVSTSLQPGGTVARINFEDSVYKHPNFPKLLIKVGDEYRTKGMLITAWELAHLYWLEFRGIPKSKWPADLDVLIEATFASVEKRSDGDYIYVAGSREACAYLEARSAGGKKGGKSKNPAKLQHLAQHNKAAKTPKQSRNKPVTEPNLTETSSLTLSLPLSSISNSELSTLPLLDVSSAEAPDPAAETRPVWEAYRDAYVHRYMVEPVRNAMVNRNVKDLVARVGQAEAIELVRFYLTHNDPFYLRNTHAIKFCLANAETLRTQMLRGRPITQGDIKRFTEADHFQSQLKRINEGEV